jgi:hypothetical protein
MADFSLSTSLGWNFDLQGGICFFIRPDFTRFYKSSIEKITAPLLVVLAICGPTFQYPIEATTSLTFLSSDDIFM